jgi:hypothetical protein
MFDVEATKRFYLEYLGCQLDWQDGDGTAVCCRRRLQSDIHASIHHAARGMAI